jgi:hypothetical protein
MTLACAPSPDFYGRKRLGYVVEMTRAVITESRIAQQETGPNDDCALQKRYALHRTSHVQITGCALPVPAP